MYRQIEAPSGRTIIAGEGAEGGGSCPGPLPTVNPVYGPYSLVINNTPDSDPGLVERLREYKKFWVLICSCYIDKNVAFMIRPVRIEERGAIDGKGVSLVVIF